MVNLYVLVVDELHFDGAHYLNKQFGKCMNLHGHRWYVRNLEIVESERQIVDFGKVKEVVDSFDHCLIIPEEHKEIWEKVKSQLPCEVNIKTIPAKLTLVEHIKDELKQELLTINGVIDVSFDLYETDVAGVKSEWR